MICSVDGCLVGARVRGFCAKHYSRWLRHGDPVIVKPRGGARAGQRGGAPWPHVAIRIANRIRFEGDCWVVSWGPTSGIGHRQISLDGRPQLVHRIAWELWLGPIPDDLLVCHRCDNPPCVNPAHLFLGTYADNNRDMRTKGRGRAPRGEQHRSASLTEADVREIRRRYAAGEATQKELGAEYGVSARSAIYKIVNGKSWQHVTEETRASA